MGIEIAAAIVVVLILLYLTADLTEGFNMNMMTKWPQYTRTPRPTYDPETVIQETVPYLRSGQPFQTNQLVVRDNRCLGVDGDSCDRASQTIESQVEFADSSIGMPEEVIGMFRSPHEIRMKKNEGFIGIKRQSKPEGMYVSREDVIENTNRNKKEMGISAFDLYESKSGDRSITGSNSYINNYIPGVEALNYGTLNWRDTYADENGKESTGLIFGAIEPINDVHLLPQNHPTIMHEKHRIATQVNNAIGPLERRMNLEKTLVADVLRYREIPQSFGGA